MPEISRFYGIVIRMFYSEHPPPHFHAQYGEAKIQVSLDDAMSIEGRFPRRALIIVLDWAERHREELLADWERARRGEPLQPIPPLE